MTTPPATAKEETPSHIKKYLKHSDQVDEMLKTTKLMHSTAYATAANDLLMNDKGHVDYKKLDDAGVQDKFLDKMIGHYEASVKQRLGLESLPEDAFEKEVLLQKYVGITREQLKRTLGTLGSDYNLDQHEKTRDSLVNRQSQELSPLAASHLDESHIESILSHTGVKDYFKKDSVNIQEALNLLNTYAQRGSVGIGDLDALVKQVGDFKLSDKGKEELKKFRKGH